MDYFIWRIKNQEKMEIFEYREKINFPKNGKIKTF